MLEKRNPPIGARPGTLAIPPGSPPPRIHLFEHGPGGVEERDVADPEELVPYADTGTTTWIDVQGLGDEAVLRRIAEIFRVHPLALEDAVNVPQRAKSELFEGQQLWIARAPLVEGGELGVPQVCLILGRRYLLTFQERYFGFFEPVRERIRAGLGPIRGAGPDYLLYALVDVLVDRYYPVVEEISRELDDLEDLLLERPETGDLARLHRLRREVATLRRVAWPMRESIFDQTRGASPFLGDETRTYLRDTHDHLSQIQGRLDFCREVAVGLMDLYLSAMGHNQNEIMKVLTLMASIFIPLTFIAGIYGMNFQNMPELQTRRGYFVVLGVMVAIAVALVAYFRHRGWLGGRRRRRPDAPDRRE